MRNKVIVHPQTGECVRPVYITEEMLSSALYEVSRIISIMAQGKDASKSKEINRPKPKRHIDNMQLAQSDHPKANVEKKLITLDIEGTDGLKVILTPETERIVGYLSRDGEFIKP